MSAVNNYAPADELDFRRDIDPNSLYELVSLLGEGSYGAVYNARSRDPNRTEEVAIKIIPDADDDLTSLWREIRFLQVLRSPFVVSFIESLLYDNELWLVMELCDGGSLFDLKEAVESFTEPELQAIMAFSTIGLAHLHTQRSIHRDVKSGNILLTKDGRAKLGDFGISAQLTDTIMKRRTVIGSPYWMAPEVIQETSYDGKADIWSLGITLLELCEGNPPHFNVHPMRAIFIISSRPAPTFKDPDKWSPDMVDFLSHCLVKNCETRWTASELLKHPWLRRTVKEIGAHGRGLPVLRDLITENWDEIERIRCQRFNLPAAGADISPHDDDQHLRQTLSGSPQPMHEMSSVPVLHTSQSVNGHPAIALELDESIHSSEKSQYDDSTMRTIRRENSFGMPATRQQMRNRTLSRSNSRSSTPVGTPMRQGSVRRPLYNASSSNIGANFNYESDEAAASTRIRSKKLSQSVNDVDMMRGDSKQADAKSENDFKRNHRVQPGHDARNDEDRDHKRAQNHVEEEELPDDRGGSMMRVAHSSMARVPQNNDGGLDDMVRVTPGKAGAAPTGGGFMSALKFFQDEPMPTETQHGYPAGGAGGAAAQRGAEAKGHSSMVRVPVPSATSAQQAAQPSSGGNKEPKHRNTTPTVEVDEEEVLNELTEEDTQNLLIKKEIMKHLSALKKQYRDDLESLTQSYEGRRRVLKEALLLYSTPNSASDPKGMGQSFKLTSAAESARHAKSRHDEK